MPWWAPYGAGLLALLLSVGVWRALERAEQASVDRAASMSTGMLEAELAGRITSISNALSKLAAHTELLRGIVTKQDGDLEGIRRLAIDAWIFDARRIVETYPSTLSIEFLWADFTWRGALHAPVPTSRPPDPLTERPLVPIKASQNAFDMAREEHGPAISDPFELEGGHVGFRIIEPVFRGQQLDGYISGIVRADDLVGSVIGEQADDYSLLVTADPYVIYPTAAQSRDRNGWLHTGRLDLPGGTTWTLTVGARGKLFTRLNTLLPELFLAGALAISLLIMLSLRFARTASLRTRDLHTLTRELEDRVRARTTELATANSTLRSENELRRLAQRHLARSNDDLRQFAALVSHELRQPLATMQIWSDLLTANFTEALGDQGRGYLDKLAASVARMTRLIEGELKLAHVAYADVTHERVDVGELLEQLAADVEPELSAVRGRIETTELPALDADPAQLQQVFRNLIENAIKYHRPDVPLIISIEGRLVSGSAGESVCEIVVRDNGRGFDTSDADAIFSIFRRLEEETTPGSGIGLAICRRIVERHGGSIAAEGHPGAGATFRILLPAEHDSVPRVAQS